MSEQSEESFIESSIVRAALWTILGTVDKRYWKPRNTSLVAAGFSTLKAVNETIDYEALRQELVRKGYSAQVVNGVLETAESASATMPTAGMFGSYALESWHARAADGNHECHR